MCKAINHNALRNILQGKTQTTFMKGGDNKSPIEEQIRLAILAMAYHFDKTSFSIEGLLAFGKVEVEECELLDDDTQEVMKGVFYGLHINDVETIIMNRAYKYCLGYDQEVKDIVITDRGIDSINRAIGFFD